MRQISAFEFWVEGVDTTVQSPTLMKSVCGFSLLRGIQLAPCSPSLFLALSTLKYGVQILFSAVSLYIVVSGSFYLSSETLVEFLSLNLFFKSLFS